MAFRYLNVSVGGAFHLTIPVWISIGAFFLFDERLVGLQLAGAGLVLLGCFKAIRPRDPSPAKEKNFPREGLAAVDRNIGAR